MAGCFCCFHARKPPRENPMHEAPGPLARHEPEYFAAHHHPPQATIAHSEGLSGVGRLKDGFRTFKKTIYDQNPKLFGPLKTGQSPKYMVFACSDSRVCPSVTLNLKPGEAFTVRDIAGIVPAYNQRIYSVGSTIEFAVKVLKVECIVVIGHSCCGGIRRLLSLKEDKPHTYHFIDDWVKIALAAKKKVERENSLMSFDRQCTVLEQEVVNLSLGNLKTYPFVMDQVATGKLKLIGAYYDFVHGSFETWHP